MSTRRIARAIGALLIGTLGCVVTTTGVAHAASQLGLVDETFNVKATGTMTLALSVPDGSTPVASAAGTGGTPKASVVVTAFEPVATRVEVAAAIAGTLGTPVDRIKFDGADVITHNGTRIDLKVPLEDTHNTPAALLLTHAGIYPVQVQLVEAGVTAAQLITFVHRLPSADEAQEDPIQIGMAVSASMDVTLDDNLKVVVSQRTIDSMSKLADVLEASSVPMAVRVPPAVMEALADGGPAAAEIATRISKALEENTLLSTTRLPLDASSAASAGQQELYTQWLRDGEDSLARTTSSPAQRSITLVDDPLDQDGGALVRNLGARLLVMAPGQYDTLPHTLGGYTDTTQLVQLSVGKDTTVNATITDRLAERALGQVTTTPELTAVQMVADLLAARQQIVDDGGDPRRHGITLAAPSLTLPSADLVKPLTELLATTPGLRPTTLDDLSVRTDQLLNDGKPVVVGLPTAPNTDVSGRMALTEQLSLENASTSSMLPSGDARQNEWKRLIDSLPTNAVDDTQAARIADTLHTAFSVVRSAVRPPTGFSFNLTGRNGSVPVTIKNTATYPITVRVRMTSSKLIFPKGDQTITLAPNTFTELRIPLSIRSNGRFPVTLDIFTPLGDVRLGTPIPLTANVRGMSGLGNLVTGAALLVLLSWWIRHVRRNRRRRLAVKASDRHPARRPGAEGETGDESDGTSDGTSGDDDSGLSPDAATSTLPPS